MTKYRIVHNNHYSFTETVNSADLEARLRPQETSRQTVEFSQFVVQPLASSQRTERDRFGNHKSYFKIKRNLQSFTLSAIHTVITSPSPNIELEKSVPWEQVVKFALNEKPLIAPYATDRNVSAYVKFNQNLYNYTKASFLPGRPLLAASYNLMQRIYQDFQYDPYATQINTTAIESFELKRGVCQDFSHIAIACLRALKIPVRYVSGYVDTKLTSNNPLKYGGDVSHAWFSVYDPEAGWVDFDPTNNGMLGESYITVACGRDYNDVSPLKGVVDNPGENRLRVNVDMTVLS